MVGVYGWKKIIWSTSLIVSPAIPKKGCFASEFAELLNFCMNNLDTIELPKKNGCTNFDECSHFSQVVKVFGTNLESNIISPILTHFHRFFLKTQNHLNMKVFAC